MTPAEEKILAQIESLKLDIDKLHVCLIGNKLQGEMGVLDIIESHRRELYGDAATQELGIKAKQAMHHKRLESLEGDRMKLWFISGAVSATIGIVWTIVKTFFLK